MGANLFLAVVMFAAGGAAPVLTPEQSLGRALFFDEDLSSPPGISCASCHDPAHGFAEPRPGPTSSGSIPRRFGSRNSPTIGYSAHSPPFFFNAGMGPMSRGVYEGGQNWDGKAATLADQAKLPFLNPLEMNNARIDKVVHRARKAQYAGLLDVVCGQGRSVEEDFDCIARAIAAWESSAEVNRFDSKYDAFLAGRVQLSAQEQRGLTLFEGKAACARCHRSRPTADGAPPMFTSRHHANVGVPRDEDNRFYLNPPPFNPAGVDYLDPGTGAVVQDPFHNGRFKIPTLRNVALTAPYMHNGVFPSLTTVVHFYNTRDVPGSGWAAPEWDLNIIRADKLGSLGLSSQEEEDVVAFLQALTDGFSGP